MLILTPKGLYAPAGDFYIDPCGAVDRAVITHAHSDHARKGSRQYFCVESGLGLLKNRLGKNISVRAFAYGERFSLGETEISFHPAGHILGSAQVRLQRGSEIWVVSGDYKRDPDPTCEPFQPVPCDVFITEATFGTPAFRWDKSADIGREIHDWWQDNSSKNNNSLLFAYSLGKTQRVLGLLEPFAKTPVYCHPSAFELTECYRKQGMRLAPTICMSTLAADQVLQGQLILAPQSLLRSPAAIHLGQNFKTAFASGWMARDTDRFDRGFLLSDHADWDDLVRTVLETQSKRVYVLHRGKGALVRHLNKLGIEAHPIAKLQSAQLPLF